MASQKSDITLYTTQTPNGIKISITLEELGYVSLIRYFVLCLMIPSCALKFLSRLLFLVVERSPKALLALT